MKKDASVKLGETRCDFCNEVATHIAVDNDLIYCEGCALLVKTAGFRESLGNVPLKSAGIILRDAHR